MSDLIDHIPSSAAAPETDGTLIDRPPDDPRLAKELLYARRLERLARSTPRTPREKELLELITRRAVGESTQQRRTGSVDLFVGPSNSGKRHIARKISSLAELQPRELSETVTAPVMILEANPTVDVTDVLLAIERHLDPAVAFGQNNRDDLRQRIYHLVRNRRLRWLVIPNAKYLFDEKTDNRSRMLAQTLAAMVDHPSLALRLVLCGDHAMAKWINRSALRTYADFHEFEELTKPELRTFAQSYVAVLPELDVQILGDSKFLDDLMKATDSRPGAVVRLVEKAVAEMKPVETSLSVDHFRSAYRVFDKDARQSLFRARIAKTARTRTDSLILETADHPGSDQ